MPSGRVPAGEEDEVPPKAQSMLLLGNSSGVGPVAWVDDRAVFRMRMSTKCRSSEVSTRVDVGSEGSSVPQRICSRMEILPIIMARAGCCVVEWELEAVATLSGCTY